MGSPLIIDGLALNAERATGLCQTTGLWDRAVAFFTEHQGMLSRVGHQRQACSDGLIDALLHQVICEVSDISHVPPHKSSD